MDTIMLGPVIKVRLCKESHAAVEYVYAWKTFHLRISSCTWTGDALTPQTSPQSSCLELNVWTPVVGLVAYIHIGCVDSKQMCSKVQPCGSVADWETSKESWELLQATTACIEAIPQ
jgi:hypothetical protein